MNTKIVDNQIFTANGKLLLSGEYTILDGAYGIGLPARFGQELRVFNGLSVKKSLIVVYIGFVVNLISLTSCKLISKHRLFRLLNST